MSLPQRFILKKTAGNAWFILDTSDDSSVCFVHRGSRPMSKTQAMVKVMLDALNAAGAPLKKAPEQGNG